MTRLNTKHLFLERLSPEDKDKYQPLYTMQEQDVVKDGITYTSMYRLYIEAVDEYSFADTHLGGASVWSSLLSNKWFVEGYRCHRGIDAWREDLRARDESTAKAVLLVAAKSGDVPAAKKLFDLSKRNEAVERKRTKQKELNTKAEKSEELEFLDNAALRLNVVSIRD